MPGFIKNILKASVVAIIMPWAVFGVQQPNQRGVSNSSRDVVHSADSESDASVRRSATSVIARSAAVDKRELRPVVTARPATVRGATIRSVRPVIKNSNIVRSATKSSVARSGTKTKTGGVNISRAGTARATAVFNDVSKIGGGYSSCRDSYATCMDQICANANDTYRRCFCSDRFTEFRDTSDRLDDVLKLLAEFQNVNLDAVNKTAAEVDAMYSATEGEAAIKRDTSASQKLLDSIAEILSSKSKKKYSSTKSMYNTSSLGVLDLSSFSTTVNDAFSDSSSGFNDSLSFSFNGGSSYKDVSSLEGADLYEAAMQQCSRITRESCGGDAMFNLARSSYSILVTQDCNTYEKNINAKKTSVEDTVRKAEKYLREARLEEYRAHNSQDMNECLSAVDNAMRQQFACGPSYESCLDYTGLYISATGEPVYSQALFGLSNLIKLDGSTDVLGANPDFATWLNSKRSFAASALDTCRGIADDVWEEYKRVALIKIAQAQDDKIEQVKDSCVETIKECYDTQTGAMNSLAEDVSQSATKAISAIAARDACKQKVFACAALYGDVDGCAYDDATKKISNVAGKKCGLQSMLALVDATDRIRFEKGCEEALREYATEICSPVVGDTHKYPWGCRTWSKNKLTEELKKRAEIVCISDFGSDYNMNSGANAKGNNALAYKNVSDNIAREKVNAEKNFVTNEKINAVELSRATVLTKNTSASNTQYRGMLTNIDANTYIGRIVDEISEALEVALGEECEDLDGVWVPSNDSQSSMQTKYDLLTAFYTNVFGGNKQYTDYGTCAQNTIFAQCQNQNISDNQYATYDEQRNMCVFTDEWYKNRCVSIGGYYLNSVCRVLKGN